ncbi:MAG: glycosyltransferase family 9 protein [Bacteroidota bacterium]
MDVFSKLARFGLIEARTLFTLLQNGAPDRMLQFGGGIGDELLLTTVAHELKRRDPSLKIWQVSHSAELLRYNPDYQKVFTWDDWYLRYSSLLNRRRTGLSYATELIPMRAEVPPEEHVLKILCRKAGIKGEVELRPYYTSGADEKEFGSINPGQVAVQVLGKDSYSTVPLNKLWDTKKFQTIVDILKETLKCQVIQLGLPGDPPLKGVIDLRGKTELRETARVISQSAFFVGMEGLLMHLARAVNRRAVVIFGGRIHSWQIGYPCNENLNSMVDCAPCWKWNDCDYERKCMTMISVDEVMNAVQRLIQRLDAPLETDTATL